MKISRIAVGRTAAGTAAVVAAALLLALLDGPNALVAKDESTTSTAPRPGSIVASAPSPEQDAEGAWRAAEETNDLGGIGPRALIGSPDRESPLPGAPTHRSRDRG